ncbi:hypothetical protein [Metabacillus endolithicus]|uniref:Uncharacterized protein n=1 Tax=Metabacillus endolithicus TaxID=1535204 RepID=A0ABW5C212_9BACI|nr:hypothetical protein [Metabacillus endolithicus]UPG66029.1 hypothetical protein MVE64_26650 [Metabacillus endolithicus]
MKLTKTFNILMILLPWLSLPLVGLKYFKRYFPSAISMCIYLMAEGRYAEKKKWWWFPSNIKRNFIVELPLIIGPFFIGSLWVLKYTYGKFKLYFFINLLVDSFFTYFVIDWFKKIGYVTLVRLSKFQLSIVFLIKTFVLYGSQLLYEKQFKSIQSEFFFFANLSFHFYYYVIIKFSSEDVSYIFLYRFKPSKSM